MVLECEISVNCVSLIFKRWFPSTTYYLLWQKLSHCLVCSILQNSFEQTNISMFFLNVTRHKAWWFSWLLLKVLHVQADWLLESSDVQHLYLPMPTHLAVWVCYVGLHESHLKRKALSSVDLLAHCFTKLFPSYSNSIFSLYKTDRP